MEGKLVLINSNTPSGADPLASWRQPEASFSSKHLAAKELKISTKTISKYLDINRDYKGLYFYSIKV